MTNFSFFKMQHVMMLFIIGAVVHNARTAHAQSLALGVSTAYSNATSPHLSDGSETGGYLGSKIDGGFVAIQPEFMATYTTFGSNVHGGRFVAGGRAWLGVVLLPGAYAHIGYGDVGIAKGSTYDFGGLLDLSVGFAQVGLHVGYEGLDNLKWVSAGLHAQLNL